MRTFGSTTAHDSASALAGLMLGLHRKVRGIALGQIGSLPHPLEQIEAQVAARASPRS